MSWKAIQLETNRDQPVLVDKRIKIKTLNQYPGSRLLVKTKARRPSAGRLGAVIRNVET